MTGKDMLKHGSLVLLIIVLLIAFATKAAHWDKITHKGATKDYLNEVYPGLEGMIATDVILFVFFVVFIVLQHKPNKQVSKILFGLIILMMIIRIILAIIFLAGNDEYCRKSIEYCDDNPEEICFTSNGGSRVCYQTYCGTDAFKTLKGAWVMEIIAIILVNILVPVIFFITR